MAFDSTRIFSQSNSRAVHICCSCSWLSLMSPVPTVIKYQFFGLCLVSLRSFCMGILSYYSFPMLFVVSLSTLSYIDTFFFDCRSLDFLPTKYSSCRSHFFAVLCKVLGLLLRRDVSGFKADFSYSCLWEFVCCFDFILNGEVDRLSTLLLVRFLRGLMVDD